MLSLASETPPTWLPRVLPDLAELLVDHAHCEKKAASTALALLFKYPERAELLRPLSELAREELRHFEAVLDLLAARDIAFRRLVPSAYAKRLRKAVRTTEPECLIDTLLCCALIEARSCERMKLLSEGLPDAELARFYGELLASEARHFAIYLEMAETLAPRAAIKARLDELASHEALAISGAPPLPRMHA